MPLGSNSHHILNHLQNRRSGAPIDPLAVGLVGYWGLSDLADAVANSDLTNNNGATFAAGKIDNAAAFDAGSTQYLSISPKTWGVEDKLSISFWYNASADGCIVQLGDDAASTIGSVIKYELYSGAAYIYGGPSAGGEMYYNNIPHTNSQWTHVVVIVDGTSVKVYQQGVEVSINQVSALSGLFADDNRGFYIGAGSNSGVVSPLTGSVDEVGLWSRALTEDEITRLYNGGTGLAHPFAA